MKISFKSTLAVILFFSVWPIFTSGFEKDFDTDYRIKTFIPPVRILWKSTDSPDNIFNEKGLLHDGPGQAGISGDNICRLKNSSGRKASILLDFGRELHGGLQIVTHNTSNGKPVRIRLRFGESASEAMSEIDGVNGACNDHSMRDYEMELPWLGTTETGHTGFRFVRLDLLDDNTEVELRQIRATFIRHDIEYTGSFECNDTLLNKIWSTGAYTVFLNMQNYLWDGIKRDRLVWIGDIHPEIMTIGSVFGYNDIVNKSIDLVKNNTPLPGWMNGISSYSIWWLIIQRDWYYFTGNIDYLLAQKSYLTDLIQLLISKIDESGHEHLDGMRFLDWPSNANSLAIDAGLHALMTIAMEYGAELCNLINEEEMALQCIENAKKLETSSKTIIRDIKSDSSFTNKPGYKQAAALLFLAGLTDDETANNQLILKNGAKDFSTFYGYYMLTSLGEGNHIAESIDIIKKYWGGMLKLGATTFWEDFDISWMENASGIDKLPEPGKTDVHASYGNYCYKGYRHSLCHGWASGPTPWLSKYVLGVKILEPGCRHILIQPQLGNLEWAKGTFPTPEGPIYIEHHRKKNGKIKTVVKAPEGIKITIRN